MKPFAITLDVGTSLNNHTGSWRTVRPEYVKRLPPCNNACPAGENIQEWLSLIEKKDYEGAWREVVKNNPMPAVMGRVCYHTCENACNRKTMDMPVGINSIERFLGDEAIKNGWSFDKTAKPSGKHVLVVGSGPAGLSAAYHLACLGHKVTIKEALPMAGGMMRYGIPKYRLPRNVLDAEIKRIIDLGIELQLNAKVTDVIGEMNEGHFDAVFLAVGAHVAKRVNISTSDKMRIPDAVSVLRSMEGKKQPILGNRVVVYGGGNTALDVARTAVRLGAKEVTIVYRRNREKMPAHDFEVEEALQEGVNIKWLSTIKHIDKSKITLEKMVFDDEGTLQATGETEIIVADAVVLAIGQDADLSFLDDIADIEIVEGIVKVDNRMETGYNGIFAGGDMVTSSRTVTVGIGHGKKAARHMDAWLRNIIKPFSAKADLATEGLLNKWYYTGTPKTVSNMLDIERRKTSFDEVDLGISKYDAVYESSRCLSCGNCFECDNCYGVCPDNAITKLGDGKGFSVNYDYCKGCGICAVECPCGAIEMKAEEI